MITGANVVLFTTDAEADRRFFRDVLGFPSVDAGGGTVRLYQQLHPTPPRAGRG